MRYAKESWKTWSMSYAAVLTRRKCGVNFKHKASSILQGSRVFLSGFFKICGFHRKIRIGTKFMITLWYIWKWRYAYCLEGMEEIPRAKGVFLFNKFREVLHALQQENHVSGTCGGDKIDNRIRWEPPARDWKVLKTAQHEVIPGWLAQEEYSGVVKGNGS